MDETGKGKVVCVTGASGYIGSWLVKNLLLRGYTVNATVRDPNDVNKTEHLVALEGAKERLHLFKADLMDEGSFDPAVLGCQGVFHTASPVKVDNVKDPQAELLDPAVKGTLSVLNSCAKVPSIKRVVLTSSIAAVIKQSKPKTPELWYALSKTLAEIEAWKFAKEKGIDMVTINPALVIGPFLQPTLNPTASIIANLINGAKSYPNQSYSWVNIKDVITAHIQALETPSANGRYCIVESIVHYSTILELLRDMYPNFTLPEKCADDKPIVPTYQVSKVKAKSLGIDYIPLKVSIKETVEGLKENGLISL